MDNYFTQHNCHHFFTNYLSRAGMMREFIQELRGDSRLKSIDIYDHIDLQELKEAYLACISTIGALRIDQSKNFAISSGRSRRAECVRFHSMSGELDHCHRDH